MKTRSIAVIALMLVALVGAAEARPKPMTPEAFVTALYKDHFAHKQRWDLTLKTYHAKLAPELAGLLDESDRKQAANPDEVVGIDFNPMTDSQEEAQSFKLTGTTHEGADAIVAVTVKIYTETRTIRVRLTPDGDSWRIANLLYADGDLIKYLKEPM